MSAQPQPQPQRGALETFAGLMAAVAIFLGVLGITNLNLSIAGESVELKPVRIGVAAILLALVAAGLGGRHQRLAAIAVAVTAVSWFLAMVVAVVTERPLF